MRRQIRLGVCGVVLMALAASCSGGDGTTSQSTPQSAPTMTVDEPLVTLIGHTDWVLGAEFTPDGKTVITVSGDGDAKIWDAATGSMSATLPHADSVWDLDISPDGAMVVTTSLDGLATVWDVATGAQIVILKLVDLPSDNETTYFPKAEFSPDGSKIATTSWDESAEVWETTSWTRLHTFAYEPGDKAWAAAFNPDGTLLATAANTPGAQLWDMNTGELATTIRPGAGVIISPDIGGVGGLAFSPDGSMIATAATDGTAQIWDTATGDSVADLVAPSDASGQPSRMEFAPDSKTMVVVYEPPGLNSNPSWSAGIWDAATSELTTSIPRQRMASVLAVSSDASAIVSSSAVNEISAATDAIEEAGTGTSDGTTAETGGDGFPVTIWDAATGQPRIVIAGHPDVVNSASFSSGGGLLVTTSHDNTAMIWQL